MNERERIAFVQRRYSRLGLYNHPVTGFIDADLRAANARYTKAKGREPTNVDGFDTYSLLTGGRRTDEAAGGGAIKGPSLPP